MSEDIDAAKAFDVIAAEVYARSTLVLEELGATPDELKAALDLLEDGMRLAREDLLARIGAWLERDAATEH